MIGESDVERATCTPEAKSPVSDDAAADSVIVSRKKQLASSNPVSTTCTNMPEPSTPMSQKGVGSDALPD